MDNPSVAIAAAQDTASQEPFTRAAELIVDGAPGLRAELRSLVLRYVDHPDRSGAQTIEELLRERCESHAGIDINENDMLTPLARELLLHVFSRVNWRSLAEKLTEQEIEAGSTGSAV